MSPAPLHVRQLDLDQFDALADSLDLAFHERVTASKRAAWRRLFAFERSVGAFDGELLVGTAGAYPQRLSIPGGELACAGVTIVTVRPTHRRRGILTRMMEELFAQAQSAGEPIAGLWASEGAIYERFGFGVAAQHADLVLRGGAAAPRPSLEPRGEYALELREPAGAMPLLAPVWERMRALRPGIPARTEQWWEHRILADLDGDRPGTLPLRLLLAREAGEPGAVRGYALYRARGSEPNATLKVEELIAPDPEAEAALWGLLSGVDLVGTVEAPERPLDDAAPYRFADFRQARVTNVHDGLWLRLLDLPAALSARRWNGPLDLTLEVADRRLPANAGRWRLQLSADGEARCTRTDRAADLRLDVAALGAAYLGGTPIARLLDAGRAVALTPGAAERLDAALHVPRAPWTPEHF